MPAYNKKVVNPGDKINNWTIIKEVEPRTGTTKSGRAWTDRLFDVMCECGVRAQKSFSDMRKYSQCQTCLKTKYKPGTRIGQRTIIEEVSSGKAGRYFIAECICGRIHKVRLDSLKKYPICSNKQDCTRMARYHLEAQHIPVRHITKTQPYTHWENINKEVCGEVCEEWKDFYNFLDWYVEVTGVSAEQLFTVKAAPNVITLVRINKEINWNPDNVEVRHFFTERANHRPTYQYWTLLKAKGLLEPEIAESYVEFVNTFGQRPDGTTYLQRIDPRKLHSRSNSKWVQRKSRTRDSAQRSGSTEAVPGSD